jgi:hypothetical protein
VTGRCNQYSVGLRCKQSIEHTDEGQVNQQPRDTPSLFAAAAGGGVVVVAVVVVVVVVVVVGAFLAIINYAGTSLSNNQNPIP